MKSATKLRFVFEISEFVSACALYNIETESPASLYMPIPIVPDFTPEHKGINFFNPTYSSLVKDIVLSEDLTKGFCDLFTSLNDVISDFFNNPARINKSMKKENTSKIFRELKKEIGKEIYKTFRSDSNYQTFKDFIQDIILYSKWEKIIYNPKLKDSGIKYQTIKDIFLASIKSYKNIFDYVQNKPENFSIEVLRKRLIPEKVLFLMESIHQKAVENVKAFLTLDGSEKTNKKDTLKIVYSKDHVSFSLENNLKDIIIYIVEHPLRWNGSKLLKTLPSSHDMPIDFSFYKVLDTIDPRIRKEILHDLGERELIFRRVPLAPYQYGSNDILFRDLKTEYAPEILMVFIDYKGYEIKDSCYWIVFRGSKVSKKDSVEIVPGEYFTSLRKFKLYALRALKGMDYLHSKYIYKLQLLSLYGQFISSDDPMDLRIFDLSISVSYPDEDPERTEIETKKDLRRLHSFLDYFSREIENHKQKEEITVFLDQFENIVESKNQNYTAEIINLPFLKDGLSLLYSDPPEKESWFTSFANALIRIADLGYYHSEI